MVDIIVSSYQGSPIDIPPGISGYHMVKVLAAAPERWSKIYCLSRRPPPDYFYDGLGEGATRVEHVEADFLAKPEQIAENLKQKIKRV